jgi:hypothetical protein
MKSFGQCIHGAERERHRQREADPDFEGFPCWMEGQFDCECCGSWVCYSPGTEPENGKLICEPCGGKVVPVNLILESPQSEPSSPTLAERLAAFKTSKRG